MHPPKEVMRELHLARFLETCNRSALRIHAAEEMPNDPILTAGIERLQHDQERLAPVRKQKILKPIDSPHSVVDLRNRGLARCMLPFVGRIDLVETNSRARLDREFLSIVHRAFLLSLGRQR